MKGRKVLKCLIILLSSTLIALSAGQVNPQLLDHANDLRHRIGWCTVGNEEYRKCSHFAQAAERELIQIGYDEFTIECYNAFNKAECMQLIDAEKMTFTTLDAGEVFVGGRYHSLIPIVQEVAEGGLQYNYAVAVVKKGTMKDVTSLRDLRDKRACFAGVDTLAGWTLPIYTLMKEGGMKVIDCNNHVKTATEYFGPSCAVNALTDKNNPIGDNSDKLCSLCIGRVPGGKCTDKDPYAGFEGAFRCLLEAGDVAFLKDYTVHQVTSRDEFTAVSKDSFELLCKDGTRRPIDDFRACNWGSVPSNAIVTTSVTSIEMRRKYQKFLDKVADIAEYSRFFSLPEDRQTYSGYLGRSLEIVMGVRECPVNRMTLCVTSDAELEKCVKMRTALQAQLLKPEMVCYKGHSQIHCMQAIRSGTADVTLLDASDVYTAGLNFDLVPFMSEIYNLDRPEYYVVAVAKESDPDTEITYLKGKNTCHGGINTAAGWVYPMAYLISNGWIRPYGCNSIRAAAEYFTKMCVPGAISTEYNTGVPYDNMCHLCHGASFRYCRRDASEDYYGHTGAFRCLVEGGGHVAFVKHTTVIENTGGKRREWWARDNLVDDFELLCPDGTRAEVNDYPKCNLGKAKSNAIVTRGAYGYNSTQINAYINLFLYSQTFYGRKIPDEFSFSMFYSPAPYSDLIFQDATTQLQVIPPEYRSYADYLGKDFMRARRIVDCHAGAGYIHVFLPNWLLILGVLGVTFTTLL